MIVIIYIIIIKYTNILFIYIDANKNNNKVYKWFLRYLSIINLNINKFKY